MAFCKEYNAATQDKVGTVIPVEITVFEVSTSIIGGVLQHEPVICCLIDPTAFSMLLRPRMIRTTCFVESSSSVNIIEEVQVASML